VTLKSRLRVTQGHWKLCHSKAWVWFAIPHTMVVSVAVCEIFSVKEWFDLVNRVRVRSRSLEMAHFPSTRSCHRSLLWASLAGCQISDTIKLCLLIHSVSTQRCLAYLSQLVQPVANLTCRHGLRSSNSQVCAVPRTRTKLGERVFSVAGPSAWNALPDNLRCINDTPSFKHQLKTHLFTIAFDV